MEQNMGKQRVVDKAISPQQILQALQAGSITFAQAQQMFNGVIPIGDFRGIAAALDIDLLVKQPLVLAEQQHILGILDGRLEDYDKQTITIPKDAVKDSVVAETLTVPTGEVWFVTIIELAVPAESGGRPAVNWHCDLWTDPAATPSDYGQPFHSDPLSDAAGAAEEWYDEFHPGAPFFAGTNFPMMLRLPAGTVLTLTAKCLNGAATTDLACTIKLYGFIGKSLVD